MASSSVVVPLDVTYRQTQLLVATWITCTVAAISVILRFVSRHISKAGLWYDDWLILFPMALSLVEAIWTTILVKQYNFGVHIQYAKPGAVTFFLKYLYGYQIIYTLWLSAVKYCIVLLLWRIFAVPFPNFRKYLWAATALISAWCIAILFTSLFSCVPAEAFWLAAKGTCVSSVHFFLGNAIPNIVTDIFLILLPIPCILRLNVILSQKLAIIGIFAVGSFIVAVSIIRLKYLLLFNDGEDLTFTDIPIIVWTIVEGNCAIIAACLPSMGPLLKRALRKRDVQSSAASSGYGSRGAWLGSYQRSGHATSIDDEMGDLVQLQNVKALQGSTAQALEGSAPYETIKSDGYTVNERSIDSS